MPTETNQQKYNLYTGNDGVSVSVPTEIPMRNEDGEFTDEFKNYVLEQRATGNTIKGQVLTTITPREPSAYLGRAANRNIQLGDYTDMEIGYVGSDEVPEEEKPITTFSDAEGNIYPIEFINDPDRAEEERVVLPTIRESVARSTARLSQRTGEALADVTEVGMWGVEKYLQTDDYALRLTPEESEKARRESAKKSAELWARAFKVPISSIYDEETGQVKSSETLTGYSLDILNFFSAYGALGRMSSIKNISNPFVREIVKDAALSTVLFNPEDGNFLSMFEEWAFDPETGTPPTWYQAAIGWLGDPGDSRAEARFKQVTVDTITIGGLMEVLGRGYTMMRAKNQFNKPVNQLTPEEMTELLATELREAGELAEIVASGGGRPLNVSETDEGVAQIINQGRRRLENEKLEGSFNSRGWNRLVNSIFSHRGYLSNIGKATYDQSIYNQRGAVQAASNVAGRLTRKLNDLMSESSFNEYLPEQIQEVLTSDFTLPRVMTTQNYEETIQNLIDQFSIPREIAPDVLDARLLIDDYSKRILHSDFIDDGLKEVINENIGAYLRRSYHAYETPGWTPGIDVKLDAENYFDDMIRNNETSMNKIEASVYEKFGDDISQVEFNSRVDDIITTKVKDTITEILDKDVFEYTTNHRQINPHIFKARQDMTPEIRALLGEIEDPADNVLQSILKMSKFYETASFHNNLNQLGDGKYIFGEGVARDTRIFNTKLDLPNSPLHGKYTTPEMAAQLQREIAFLDDDVLNNRVVKSLIAAKGITQQMKTVFSLGTQSRNAGGGVQFSLANGYWPFTEGVNNNAAIWNEILNLGDEAFEEQYLFMQQMGVINTSVRVNEFRSLLEIGAGSTPDTLLNRLKEFEYGGQTLKAGIEGATNVYMATDDFFKMNAFQNELKTLQEAWHQVDINILHQEAARKIKNVFPNYDRVPPGIKTARILPFGNFVSFPAEMWRTSYHIIKESASEISSSNPVIQARGRARLTGFVGSQGFWQMAVPASAITYGLSEREQEAIQGVTETPWNQGSTRNIIRVGDKFYTHDTTNYNAYNTVSSPFLEFYDEIYSGALRGEELDKILIDAGTTFATNILKPYVDESMLLEATQDTAFALGLGRGSARDGTRIFNDADNPIASIAEVMIQPFMPRFFDEGADLYNAASGNVDQYSGKIPPWQAELVAMLLGVRFQEVDPAQALRFAFEDYEEDYSNFPLPQFPDHKQNFEGTLKQIEDRQVLEIQALQKLFKTYQDVSVLFDEPGTYSDVFWEKRDEEAEVLSPFELRNYSAYSILQEADASEYVLNSMENGIFWPSDLFRSSLTIINNSIDRGTPFADEVLDPEDEGNKIIQLQDAINKYSFFPLNYMPTEETWNGDPIPSGVGAREELLNLEREQRAARGDFAKGGEVYNVPQVPREPDERIDKMTGLPYDRQAGEAFIDEEDRKTFNQGGKVGLSLNNMKNIIEKYSNSSQEKIDKDFEDILSMASNTENVKNMEYTQKNPIFITPEEKFGSIYNSIYGAKK